MILDEMLACVFADRTAIGVAVALGAKGAEMPDPNEARQRLDKSLLSEDSGKKWSNEDWEWRKVMGLVK